MKRFLTFLALCCLMAAGAWAERYHIYQNNGTLHTTGTSTFCSQWTSTQTDPQISINVTDGNGAANDMQTNSTYANNGIVCYTGNNRDKQGYKATLTVAASHGYNITGYEFDASSLTDGCTISVSDGTTTKTLTGTTAQTISKTGVNAQNFVITIQCTAGSNRNTAVLFNNFYVTYEAAEPIENEYKVVFETPSSGTPYRIPAVAQAQNGDLIFVSDYRYSKADIGMATNGKLDLKMRKKKANGTWENEKVLQACIESPTFTAFGDPCIVVDNTPGNPGKVMVTSCCGNVSYPNGSHSNHQGWARWYSTDNGDTWSSYTDISQQVVNQVDQRTGAKLAAFFIGSGKISQSKTIKVNNYNRLYCASLTTVSPDGANANKTTMNYVWYSDDFGENWHMLGTPDGNPINGGNEPKAEELPDGSVLISSRTSGGRIYNIWHYTDTEAGKGYWGTQQKCTDTYGADCNGEILVVPVTRASNSEKTYLLLQSIPADANRNYVSIYWKELTDLTKYRTAAELSNGGWTKFPVSTTTSAYSTMCQMKDGHIAFFYEEYDHNSGYDMVYKNFSVEEITNNAYSYSTLDATEKANYLTNGVGAYFDGESSAVQALAATYKAAPDADKYDALNAALQSPDELYFTPGWYRIKVGSGSAQKQAEYKGRYLYGKPLPDTWPIGVTDNANDLRTYVYITGTHDKWHIEFNHDTDAAYFATHDCKNSATPGNLSFIPNSEGTEWKIWGNNSYRWMGWELNSTPSIGSTSTDNNTNNGCYFVFEKVDAPVLVAGKVYKIKAKFATGTSDIYLSAGSTGMTLPTAEATTPQSYWIARTTNDATYPWKFQSGYGNGKYLSVANGVSETASTFDVRTCANVSGTYHLWNSQSGGRYIGTYSSTNSKHGFGDFDGKGCWADSHHAGSDYTTDYIFEEVQNVTAYTVCGEGSLNVTGITGYTYASEISAGGVVIVPSNITPTATNFTTPDGLIAIVNTDAKTITLSKTYKKGVAVTQQSDLQNGDLVIVDVKAKNATTDAVLYYVGESTSMSNRNNFRAHIYNVTEYPANHVWEVVDVNTSTTPNTFKLRSVADNTVYLPSGNTTSATNTAATFYFKESTGYNDGVNRFALAFSNNENADHYTYHFNSQPATGQGEPICFWGYGAASTDSQGAFAFYKVAEDIPTAEISLDNTTVTSSQLSELTITFTGDNAAQVQLSATQHTAYLTPKASTPAQVKAQNGKFKAAPVGAIEGNISATDETGKFSINFGDADIAAGDYELSIPEGTFLVGTTPVPVLKANYTVEEPVLEGFHIYENNGDYSNTVSSSSYKDKWLSTDTDPQFTILVTGGGRAVNNMSHNDTYADSGIVCNTGNNSIGYKSTMTVSVQSGYKITGYTFKVKNLDGNNTKVVTTADKAINTTADNQTVVVSNVNADSFTITIDGSTGNYNEGVVFTDFYVTYEGEPVVELPYTITPATINTVQPADLTTVKVMFPTDDFPELSEEEMHEYVPTLSKEGEENINATGITLNEDTGEYEITFPTTGMADGTWTLTIPQGTFITIPATESEVLPDPVPVAEISVAYKVQSIEAFTIQDHHLYTIKGAFADDVLLPLVRNGNSMKGGAESATPQTFVFLSTTHENKAGLAPLYKLGTVEGNGYFTYGGGVGSDAVPMAFLTSSTQLQGGVTWDGTAFKEGYFGMVGVDKTKNNDYRTYVVQANTNVNFNGRYNKNTISGSNQLQGTNTWSFNYILEEITGYTVYDVVVEANGANVSYTGTAGNCLTTTAQGNGGYLVVKSDVDLKPSNLSVSGITSGLSAVINISGTTITISATASHAVPATGYYYIKDTETGKYLYNDCQNCDYTQSGTKVAFDNGYVWHIESQAGVNTITLHNGEGTGYKASAGAEELDHVDVSEKNWEFEEYTDHIVPVEVKYAIFGAYVPFYEAWMTYPGNNNAAHHGGFFTFQKGATLPSKEDFGYSQNVIGQPSPDGTNWIGAELENPDKLASGTAHAYYYSQQDKDRIAEVFERSYEIFNKHVGMPGYCTEVNQDFIDNDETGTMQMMQMASEWLYPYYLAGYMSLYDMLASCNVCEYNFKYILGRLNDYVQTLELVQPAPGEAFHIAVRGNDYTEKTKYYLKNDGSVTANEEEADVFVMGSTDDTDCNALFVSNNNKVDGVENSGPHYLQNHSDAAYSMSGTYSDENNALKLETMMAAEGKDITNACLYRYGAFSVTGTDGKVITFDEVNKTWSTSADHAYMNDIATSAIELIPVEYPYNKPKFAVGSPDDHNGGYASIWLPYPMVFPDGVEAYRATSVENDGILILTKVNENHEAVAAGGYILYTPDQGEDTDPDDAANMPLVLPAPADPDDVTPCEDNVFVGSTENPLVVKEEGSWATFKENYEGTAYVLARKNGVIGYYKYKETETYLPKGKAIWFSNYEPSTSTECMQFSFGDIVEAIKALNGEATDAEIYDLQGHRLNKAVKGQVNVINGKKVMFK